MAHPQMTWFSGVIGVVALLFAAEKLAAAAPELDDATILAIFDQANTTDIWVGRLGAKMGTSEEVRMLGKMVAQEHEQVQQRGRDLAKRLKIMPTPPTNDASAGDLAKTIAMLQSKAGSEFDVAYLRHELGYHQSVINALKTTLIPAIKNEELRSFVSKLVPGFEHHLGETRAVAQRLGAEP